MHIAGLTQGGAATSIGATGSAVFMPDLQRLPRTLLHVAPPARLPPAAPGRHPPAGCSLLPASRQRQGLPADQSIAGHRSCGQARGEALCGEARRLHHQPGRRCLTGPAMLGLQRAGMIGRRRGPLALLAATQQSGAAARLARLRRRSRQAGRSQQQQQQHPLHRLLASMPPDAGAGAHEYPPGAGLQRRPRPLRLCLRRRRYSEGAWQQLHKQVCYTTFSGGLDS